MAANRRHDKPYPSASRLRPVVLMAAIVVVALHCNIATAQAFLVRFDEVGYEDAPGDIEKPDERLFTSFPFFAMLNAPFAMRGVRSDGTLTITGVLRRLPDDLYQIDDLRDTK